MKPFRLLTLAVGAAATVPRLAHRGMFVDGITYASIARNLAEGRGRFWAPSYTATVYPEFHEHPPLGFWLQSLWFRVFGDHVFVERAYSIALLAGDQATCDRYGVAAIPHTVFVDRGGIVRAVLRGGGHDLAGALAAVLGP